MIPGALPWDRSSFCLWHTENSLLLSRLSGKPHMSFSIEIPLSQNQFHFCCECHMWIQRRLVIARSSIAGECQKSMLAESPLKGFIFKWIGLTHQKNMRRYLIVKKKIDNFRSTSQCLFESCIPKQFWFFSASMSISQNKKQKSICFVF